MPGPGRSGLEGTGRRVHLGVIKGFPAQTEVLHDLGERFSSFWVVQF